MCTKTKNKETKELKKQMSERKIRVKQVKFQFTFS